MRVSGRERVCASAFVCVRKREREREKKREKKRERESNTFKAVVQLRLLEGFECLNVVGKVTEPPLDAV